MLSHLTPCCAFVPSLCVTFQIHGGGGNIVFTLSLHEKASQPQRAASLWLDRMGRTNNHVLKTALGMRIRDFLRTSYAMLGERRTALRKQQEWKSDSEEDRINRSRAARLVLLGFLL